jgi:CheY-like chemotaxis protein
MTQTLEGTPATGRTLGRRVAALSEGNAIRATGMPVTAEGHQGGGLGALTSTARSLQGAAGRTEERVRPVGVLVVDDSLVFRTGMTRAVQACDGMELVGEADGGVAALRAIAELEPDVVILDLRMPDLDGIGVLRALRAQSPPPACRVLVITATLDDGVEAEALAAGADAALSKALTRADICTAALDLAAR